MTTSSSRKVQLADAAERLLLEASDEEMLKAADADLAQKDVTRLTEAARPAHLVVKSVKTPAPRKRSKPSEETGLLRAYLQKLAKVDPQLSPNLSAAFSAKKTPDQNDIERIAVELLKKKTKK